MNLNLLEKRIDQFSGFLSENYNFPLTSVNHEYFETREGHKSKIYDLARKYLDFNSWTKEQIGSGSIAKNLIKAIEINQDGIRNNLIQWQPKYGEQSVSHVKIKEAINKNQIERIETIIYNLYNEIESPKDSFENLISFARKNMI